MQSLWSRTAQAHGAGPCRACLASSRAALARRSTTKCPGRRKIRASEVFTASYTAIMAVAAIADAKSKDVRRKDLDRRLEEARASLACTRRNEDELAASAASPAAIANDDMAPWAMHQSLDGLAEVIWSICSRQCDLEDHQRTASRRRAYAARLHTAYWLPAPLNIRRAKWIDYEAIEDAIAAEEEIRPGPYRYPLTDRQLAASRDMIVSLSDVLMTEAYRASYKGDREALRRAKEDLDGPWNMIRLVKSDGFPKYKHDHDPDSPAAAQELKHANDISRKIFKKWELARQKEIKLLNFYKRHNPKAVKSALTTTMMGKICFNIHVQSSRPDIHTYNTLIAGLLKVGENKLARVVVRNLLHNSKLRPTRQTIACLLYFYQAQGDILGFYHMVRRIIGKDSVGPKIRRMPAEDPENWNPNYQSWAHNADVVLYNDFLIERAPWDECVLEALVRGLITFEQGQHAAQILAVALKAGCAINTHTLMSLLDLIVGSTDHGAASLLIRGLCANIGDTQDLLLGDDCPDVAASRLRHVMDLYAAQLLHKAHGSGDRTSRRDLAEFLVQTPPRRTPILEAERTIPGLGRLATAVWIRETVEYIAALESITATIWDHLGAIGAAFAATEGSFLLRRLQWEGRVTDVHRTRWQRLAAFHVLHERFAEVRNQTEAYEREFLAAAAALMKPTPATEEAAAVVHNFMLDLAPDPAQQGDRYLDLVVAVEGLTRAVERAVRQSNRLVDHFKKYVFQSCIRFKPRGDLLMRYGSRRSVPLAVVLEEHSAALCRDGEQLLSQKPGGAALAPRRLKENVGLRLRQVFKRALGVATP